MFSIYSSYVNSNFVEFVWKLNNLKAYTYVTTGTCIQMPDGQAVTNCVLKSSITQPVYTYIHMHFTL
jgi:hypothetical protein